MVERLNCIIVDDEPLAIKMLENYINRTSFLKSSGAYTDPVLALSDIRRLKPELVFLDIQMPDLNGLELSKMIPAETKIIFTTAFKEYAYESYEVSAIDFLLKPIRYQNFINACQKAKDYFELKFKASNGKASDEKGSEMQIYENKKVAEKTPKRDSVFIKVNGKLKRIMFDDITFISGMRDYVMFHTEKELNPLVTHITMKAVEEMLPKSIFMRVHRSYIVNLTKIQTIDSDDGIILGDEYIRVTEAYKDDFHAFLDKNLLTK